MKGRYNGVKQGDTVLYLVRILKKSFKKGGKVYICPIILILHFGIGFGIGFGIHFSFVVYIGPKGPLK